MGPEGASDSIGMAVFELSKMAVTVCHSQMGVPALPLSSPMSAFTGIAATLPMGAHCVAAPVQAWQCAINPDCLTYEPGPVWALSCMTRIAVSVSRVGSSLRKRLSRWPPYGLQKLSSRILGCPQRPCRIVEVQHGLDRL